MKLTPIPNTEIKNENEYNQNDIVDLIEYGLRMNAPSAEYHMAKKLQQLREVAFKLAEEIDNDGSYINIEDLKIIDVLIAVEEEKRIH